MMIKQNMIPVLFHIIVLLVTHSNQLASTSQIISSVTESTDQLLINSLDYNKTCLSNVNCSLTNVICHHGKCKCKSYYLFDEKKRSCVLFEKANCQWDWQCQDIDINRKCKLENNLQNLTNGRCICKDPFQESFHTDSYGLCLDKNSKSHKQSCNYTIECKSMECYNNTCSCPLGQQWIHAEQKCQSFDESLCENDTECQDIDENRICNKSCICKKGYFADYNYECLKYAELGMPCNKTTQCNVRNSLCNTQRRNGICTCKPTYSQLNQTKCEPKKCHLSSDCQSNDYYFIDHLICKNSNCVCEENTLLDNRGYCLIIYERESAVWALNFFWFLILIPIAAIAFYLRAKYNKRYLKRTIENLSIIQLRDQSSDSPPLHIRPLSLNNGFQSTNLHAVTGPSRPSPNRPLRLRTLPPRPPPRPPPPSLMSFINEEDEDLQLRDTNNYTPPPSYEDSRFNTMEQVDTRTPVYSKHLQSN